jgi:hypothetical protein
MRPNALTAAALACTAVAVLASRPEAAPAKISLFGAWEIVEAVPAPWAAEGNHAALAAAGKRMLGEVVTFAPKEVKSKNKAFTCRRPYFEPNEVEPDALFHGNLPEPNPAAVAQQRFGFAKGDIPGVDIKCMKGQFAFHFRDRNTALTAFNNVIYTLKRR